MLLLGPPGFNDYTTLELDDDDDDDDNDDDDDGDDDDDDGDDHVVVCSCVSPLNIYIKSEVYICIYIYINRDKYMHPSLLDIARGLYTH